MRYADVVSPELESSQGQAAKLPGTCSKLQRTWMKGSDSNVASKERRSIELLDWLARRPLSAGPAKCMQVEVTLRICT